MSGNPLGIVAMLTNTVILADMAFYRVRVWFGVTATFLKRLRHKKFFLLHSPPP